MTGTVIDMSGEADDQERKVLIPVQTTTDAAEQTDQLSEDQVDDEPGTDVNESSDVATDSGRDDTDNDDVDLTLDDDPETSLVGSLSLHMLSEHAIGGALHLDESALIEAHQHAHRDTGQSHGIADLRFRPGRARDVALAAAIETPPTTAVAAST